MYSTLNGLDLTSSIFMLLCWAIATLSATRLLFRRSSNGLRFNLRLSQVFMWLGLGLAAVKLVIFALYLTSVDTRLTADRLIIGTLLALLPALAVVVLTMPTLRRVYQGANTAPGVEVATAQRSLISAPATIVPLQVAFIGALLDVYANESRPGADLIGQIILDVILLGGAAAVLWFLQFVQWRKLRVPEAFVFTNPLLRIGRALLVLVVIGAGLFAWFSVAASASRLPDSYSMMNSSVIDYGGGSQSGHPMAGMTGDMPGMINIATLTGSTAGTPDITFTLTAQQTQLHMASGATIDAWTLNGQSPGPELRVHEGDLVEVTVINQLPANNEVTLHWHGVNVPNAADGVAGVTQDAVAPGKSYTYRFRATQTGTFWYHSHQDAFFAVGKGLFGPLVILPKDGSQDKETSIVALAHNWSEFGAGLETIGDSDQLQRQTVAPGSPVRLRLINTENSPRKFAIGGTTFRVAAIDGNAINAPTDLQNTRLQVAAGGRLDVTFVMPTTPVVLALSTDREGAPNTQVVGILLSADGTGDAPAISGDNVFDPGVYGSPAATPFNAASHFDRQFTLYLGLNLGFYDGQFTGVWTIDGAAFPNTPMQVVHEGDLVKMTFVNRSPVDHPMHLHGHTLLVLSHNGQPTTGSPWWTDTLNVAPGEIYEVAFKADNPGIWMDHCHNLSHADTGMMMHLSYDNVTTPYKVARGGNQPE